MRSAISRVKPRCGVTGRSTALGSLDLGTSVSRSTLVRLSYKSVLSFSGRAVNRARRQQGGGTMRRRDLLALAGAAAITGAAGRQASAQDKMVLKAADVHPPGYPTVVAVENMGKKLEEATKGRLTVQMFGSMQLGGEVVDGPIGQELLDKVTNNPAAKLVGLCWMDAGARSFYDTKRPIKKIEDLKGLKVRVIGNPMFVDMGNALGANAVAMGYDQVFSALQTGVIDGAENNPPSFVFDNHYQVAKYYSLTQHLIVPEMLVFSRVSWDKLSPDDQALVKKVAREAQFNARELWNKTEAEAMSKMKSAGIEIDSIDDKKPFRDAVKPVWDKYGAKFADIIKRIDAVT
jgi:TRAP-type C4-dicarboxylate transport system substrate-binding protein